MDPIRIDKVYPKTYSSPMAINFKNGYITSELKTHECELYQNVSNGAKTLASEINEIVFVGKEKENRNNKTVLLARDRVTGKVRLIEVSKVDMKPAFQNSNFDTNPLEVSNLELSRKFGTKKRKKVAEQREKLKLNVSTVTVQMENVTKNISTDELDTSSFNKIDNDTFYIPPINRDATSVNLVYDIDTIISNDECDQVTSQIKDKAYIEEMVPWIREIVENSNLSPKQIVLALYASSLLKLYACTVKDILKKSFIICNSSYTLDKIVISNFTEMHDGKRTRPLSYRDRTLCHAIVFILLINNYKFDISKFCDAVKLTPAKAILKVKVTGATVVTTGNKKIVQLKLPLSKITQSRRSSKPL